MLNGILLVLQLCYCCIHVKYQFYAILRNSWISSAIAMAMSIYGALCVPVYPDNFTPRYAHRFWQIFPSKHNFDMFSLSPQNVTPRDILIAFDKDFLQNITLTFSHIFLKISLLKGVRYSSC